MKSAGKEHLGGCTELKHFRGRFVFLFFPIFVLEFKTFRGNFVLKRHCQTTNDKKGKEVVSGLSSRLLRSESYAALPELRPRPCHGEATLSPCQALRSLGGLGQSTKIKLQGSVNRGFQTVVRDCWLSRENRGKIEVNRGKIEVKQLDCT